MLYAIALALAVAGLEWLEYRYVTRVFSTEIYIVLLATGLAGLGLWAGQRLTRRREPPPGFERNDAAVRSLGLTPRECEVLELLAAGRSAQEVARQLGISPNYGQDASAAALTEEMAKLESMRVNYANPLFRIPMTFLEIFPVGLLVSLVSALLLRNPKVLPATR